MGPVIYGHNVYNVLQQKNITVDGFIVTVQEGAASLFGLPILEFKSIKKDDIGIVVGANRLNVISIKRTLESSGFNMKKVVWGNELIDNQGVRGAYNKNIHQMEITTVIGCKVNCKFCPQNPLLQKYFENNPDRVSVMSLDTFSKCLNKLPQDSVITFSGLAEPLLNPGCLEMVKLGVSSGRTVELYTTLVGADVSLVEQLSKIPFGFFVLHVADQYGYARIPVSDEYYRMVDMLINLKKEDGKPFVNVCNAQAEPDEKEGRNFMLNDEVTLVPAFEQNDVPVAVVADNLYAPYTGVFIQSLLDHVSEENNYDIIIFEREISKENKRLLKSLATGYTNVSIRFYDPTPIFALFNFNCEDSMGRFPIQVFCKIIFPYILKFHGRVIAVDVDTLLKKDISRIMDEDLEGCIIGGVYDALTSGLCLRNYTLYRNNLNMRDYYQRIYGSDDLRNYVNAGILLIDRDKYVQELDIDTILNTARQNDYYCPEQDILNVLLKGNIKILNPSWNVYAQVNSLQIESIDAVRSAYGKIYERAYENPYMLHWAGMPKPWVCPDVPWGSEWWQTALRTPFVGHIIARMMDELEKRREYFRKRYGREADVWDPMPKWTD